MPSAARNEPLLEAVACGRQYYLDLVEGRICSVKAIAANESVPSSYISRLLRCGMLAPDLVEQLIDARPDKAQPKNVCAHLPLVDAGEPFSGSKFPSTANFRDLRALQRAIRFLQAICGRQFRV